jgi:ABC-type sugar transport system permease subunit/maltose-binding protein MalE
VLSRVRWLVVLVGLLLTGTARAESIRLWHAYRGAEERALTEAVAAFEAAQPEAGGEPLSVEVLAVPYDAFSSKIEAAIPLGEGPDLFIDAHERLGSFVARKLVGPVGDALPDTTVFADVAVDAVTLDSVAYGVPLSMKSVALYYRTDMVAEPPATFEAMREALSRPLVDGAFLLAYESRGVYMHAPILHAFGGRLLEPDGAFGFVGAEAEASVRFAKALIDSRDVPLAADGALVTRLFKSGKAAYAISGPWLAAGLGDDVPYAVTTLPLLAETGKRLKPLLTVSTVMLSPHGADKPAARALARAIAGRTAGERRQALARSVSARRDVVLGDDPVLVAFSAQAAESVPMPTSVAMRAVWEPAEKALRKILSGSAEPADALSEAQRRFDDVRRPLPEPASPTPMLLGLGLLLVLGAMWLVRRSRAAPFGPRFRASLPAYAYVTHAALALGVLVFAPLMAGAAISLFAGSPGSQYFVGTANFWEILTARGGPLFATGSFYFVLLVTLLWTAVNVFFHLALGMLVGVLLSRPTLRFRAVYRVLLILPWAVPNYVTALAWKGMFHRQFGAVTALTTSVADALGMQMEPIAWFARFSTAFTANVATNVWLGFPFMMVVTIAALTAVPADCLEAAEVDGATRWQRFTMVTLPIVRPSMLPAAVLGAIWTFNMFNVVFLVSGGEPDGTTDILVSEAYRWAFTRQAQYGYAAAYAVLIFLLLFGATRAPEWWKARRARASAPVESPALETAEAAS